MLAGEHTRFSIDYLTTVTSHDQHIAGLLLYD